MSNDILNMALGIQQNTESLQKQTSSTNPSNSHPTTPQTASSLNDEAPAILPPDERLCRVCWGLGYISPSFINNIPQRAIPCTARCNSAENRLNLRRLSRIEGERQNWSLRKAAFPSQLKATIAELVKIIYSVEPAGFWYIHGPNGCGKTYIITAAVNEALRQQRSGIYTTSLELLNALRQQIAKKVPEGENKYLESFKRTTVVALDEYGRHRDSEYSAEILFNILDHRYQAAHNYHETFPAKLTLIASNLPPSETEPWLQSRLKDKNSFILDMSKLPDRRPQNE